MQRVLVPEHLLQFELQSVQVVLTKKLPELQACMQLLLAELKT